MSEEDYRNHMVNVSAPLTKDLMVKYGVKRWTQVCAPFAGELWTTVAKMPSRFITRAQQGP